MELNFENKSHITIIQWKPLYGITGNVLIWLMGSNW
jgi:hypothetical protein